MSVARVELESLETAEAAFRLEHPRYADTAVLDELRASDLARLDRGGHVYLDYTGGGLFAESQLREHVELLQADVFGNPHSLNPASAASTELVERARAYALDFFGASPEEYVAIFTPNATGALRLVGEAYPFHAGDRFLLTFDNHNSVNGIREFARARGAETTYVPSVAPDLRVDERLLPRYLTDTPGDHHNLFAYPAQSNFSGVQHPLEWIEQAHTRGWDVLLDAREVRLRRVGEEVVVIAGRVGQVARQQSLVEAQVGCHAGHVGGLRAPCTRELADAVDRVVVVEGQKEAVARVERIGLAHQSQRAGSVGRKDRHVLLR